MAAPEGNQFALGNSGSTKKWESKEALQKDIDDYFQRCNEHTVMQMSFGVPVEINKPIPYSIEGLCVALGGVTRQTLLNYEKKEGYEEYFDTIKQAKAKILANLVERGLSGDNASALTIFNLKNNYGYVDKTEVDTNHNFERASLGWGQED